MPHLTRVRINLAILDAKNKEKPGKHQLRLLRSFEHRLPCAAPEPLQAADGVAELQQYSLDEGYFSLFGALHNELLSSEGWR